MSNEELARRAAEGDRGAADALLRAIKDDVYGLALRMLGLRSEAEDATQEILLKVLTHLGGFRGESSLRTWVWRIAAHHVLHVKKGQREQAMSFETIEMLIAAGDANPPAPAGLSVAELQLAALEVRLSCTEAMLLSLDREHRIAYTLAEGFDLSGEEAAAVLEIDPAAFRKRLSRARERLGDWMSRHCGIVDPHNACRCARQVPVAMGAGGVDLGALQYAGHPERARARPERRMQEAAHVELAMRALRAHPDYAAPESALEKIRALIESGRWGLFDA